MKQIKKRKTKFIVLQGIIAFFLIILSIIVFTTRPGFFVFIFIFLILWGIVSAFWFHHYIKLPYKTMVVQPTIEGIRKGIKYSYEVTYATGYKEIFKKYNLFPLAKKFDLNDEIKDTIDEMNYTSFDLIASHQVSSGKSSHTVIDFQGKVYDVELGSTYCDYILKEDGKRIKPQGFEKKDLESIEMNDKFDLYTTNTVEIYKIFTPKLINNCNKINFFENKNSIICHIGSHFYLFLANKENQFESLANPEEIKREYNMQYETLKKYLTPFL